MHSQLKNYIKTRTDIDDMTLSYISSCFKIKKTKRNEVLLMASEPRFPNLRGEKFIDIIFAESIRLSNFGKL